MLFTGQHRDEHLLLIEVEHGEIQLEMEVIDSTVQNNCERLFAQLRI